MLAIEPDFTAPQGWSFGAPRPAGRFRDLQGYRCELIHTVDPAAGEIWWSDDLDLVLEQISDRETYRVTTLDRGDPDPALFRIPDGFSRSSASGWFAPG